MREQIVGLVMLTSMAALAPMSGCESNDGSATGTIRLPLQSVGGSGTVYRLRNATFEIRGTTSKNVFAADNSDTVLTADLAPGSYTVRLADGWSLVEPSTGNQFTSVLASPNPVPITIEAQQVVKVEFVFGVNGALVAFGEGRLEVDMTVVEPCSIENERVCRGRYAMECRQKVWHIVDCPLACWNGYCVDTRSPGVVICGNSGLACAAADRCFYSFSTDTGKCGSMPPDAGVPLTVSCDGDNDCPQGSLCCYVGFGPGTGCREYSCAGTEVGQHVCDLASPACPTGTACHPLAANPTSLKLPIGVCY